MPRVLVRPILRNLISLLGVILEVLDHTFQVAKLSNQLECSIGTDLGNRIEIVAAKQDAEVDELDAISSY